MPKGSLDLPKVFFAFTIVIQMKARGTSEVTNAT
jgi:hypothetical protein